jgi:hypothetical protein
MAGHDDQNQPGMFEAYRRDRMFEDRRSGEDRRDDEPEGLRVKWSLIAQIVGWVIGLFVIYNAMTNRIAVVETRVDTMHSDISEMKSDIKTLLMRGPK